MGEHVEIDEAVIDRRDQRIGIGMGEFRKAVGAARGIDDDHIVIDDGALDQQFRPGRVVVLAAAGPVLGLESVVAGHFDFAVAGFDGGFDEGLAVGKIAAQRPLADIDIDTGHRMAPPQQADDQVHGGGGLAAAAFFVADDDGMGGLGAHAPPPVSALSQTAVS